MKKNVLAIFAHPDDEAFGPAGTLALLANNYHVHLLCVTEGSAGEKADEKINLIEIRKKELENSARILGITSITQLSFQDGGLNNGIYHQVREQIKTIITALEPEILITFEPRGLTGHLDHIAVTSIVNHLFHKSKSVKQILYYSLTKVHTDKINDYFVHFPEGYHPHELHNTVDIASVFDKKMAAIHAHASQKSDIAFWLPIIEKDPNEYFLVKEKSLELV